MVLRLAVLIVALGIAQVQAQEQELEPAPAPTIADLFPATVTEILSGQTDGRISEMGPLQKQAMIDCVNAVLEPLPNGRKRFIVAGDTYEERERRFGEVLYENRAAGVQTIARGCSRIALSNEYD